MPARKGYMKSEHAPLRGRDQGTEAGAATVARVMAKAEASHDGGRRNTGDKPFMLESNSAKHTTAEYSEARFPR
jgi:serine protease inhibitor